MGLGAAGIMPTTLSILTNIFPAHERPKAIAVWAAVSGVGIAVGPITGGWLLEHFSWNSLFLVNLPIVAVALLGAAVLVPESRDPEAPKLDLPGAGLSIAGPVHDRLGRDRGARARLGQPGDPRRVRARPDRPGGLHRLGAATRRSPMLDVTVFRNLRFSAASLSITFVFFALMGVLFFLTTYMQAVLGYSALETGIRVLPVAVGMVVASELSVRLVHKVGTKVIVAGGLATVARRAQHVHRLRRRHRLRALRHRAVPHGRRHGPGHVARHRGDHGRAARRPRPGSARP